MTDKQLALIAHLRAENAELRKEIEWKDMVIALAQREQAKAMDTADLIDRLTAENAALREKVPQWISVEDRLPEAWINEEDNVLVNYMIYSPDFGVDIGSYHAKAQRWVCMGLPCPVTHWMPLPEAPEEGDKHGTTD